MFHVHPYLGKIPILTNIFQMGWNHQLVNELKENKGMPQNVVPYLLYNDNKTRKKWIEKSDHEKNWHVSTHFVDMGLLCL